MGGLPWSFLKMRRCVCVQFPYEGLAPQVDHARGDDTNPSPSVGCASSSSSSSASAADEEPVSGTKRPLKKGHSEDLIGRKFKCRALLSTGCNLLAVIDSDVYPTRKEQMRHHSRCSACFYRRAGGLGVRRICRPREQAHPASLPGCCGWCVRRVQLFRHIA